MDTTTTSRMAWASAAALTLGVLVTVGTPAKTAAAQASPDIAQLDLTGPTGSERFGAVVIVLENGNYVVTDRAWDSPTAADVGAVYLYDGETNAVISTLTGTTANDRISSDGVIALADGNYLVVSPEWDDGATSDVGAVTWVDGTTGITGPVTTANSLHGTTTNDRIGSSAVNVLANGNYVVSSAGWDHAGVEDVGAVTWGDGTTGITGPVTTTNSLHGTQESDRIGYAKSLRNDVAVLTNGNYVVTSPQWDNGDIEDVGAVTWGDGTTGTTGPVTTANSLHGVDQGDLTVNANVVTPLTNGNYVVAATAWNSGRGAVTWGDGSIGVTGPITVTNSLHGTTAGDQLAFNSPVAALANGNYVVTSREWNNAGASNAGAVTWGNGTTGTTGPVTTANSLHGTSTNDRIGSGGTTALTNGNYVVASEQWQNAGVSNAGAVTWGNGTIGTTGPVTTANSLHGTKTNDRIGSGGTTALTNGNYAVVSDDWSFDEIERAGATTWGDGTTGITGPVTTTNSLHGTQERDRIGNLGVTALTNGNYVVVSAYWSFGEIEDVGATTWGDGTTGITGPVTTTNSLHGSNEGDRVSFNNPVTALTNGNYTVNSIWWDNGDIPDAGAVTWADGTTGITGLITTTNSLHGSRNFDFQGDVTTYGVDAAPFFDVVPLPDGRYAVKAPLARIDGGVGAVILGSASSGVSGPVTPSNSVVGTSRGADVPVETEFVDGYYIGRSVNQLTSGGALLVPTSQNRVLLMLIDSEPPEILTLSPARIFDTRPDGATVDGLEQRGGRIEADSFVEIPVITRAGVPTTGVTAGILNVTAINPDERGYITIYPCGTRPNASSVNYLRGGVVANEVIAKLSPTGTICVYTSATTHLAIDTVGYTRVPSSVAPLDPARLLDTRPNGTTSDGAQQGVGEIPGDTMIEIPIAGRGGVPTTGAAAVLNVTAINPDERGYITIYPCGTRPNASSVNYLRGGVVANEVIAKLSPTGTICAYTSITTHLAIDTVGHIPDTSSVVSLGPARLLDTRPDNRVPADTFIEVDVAGSASIPADGVGAAILNVTAINPDERGYITIYPCGTRPNASSVNYLRGGVVANEVIAKLSPTGTICAYTSATTHLAIDTVGYVPTT